MKSGASSADAFKKALESLQQQRDELEKQTSLYGQKESAIDRAVQQVRIENQLRAQGIKLTDAQKASLGEYLDQIENLNEVQAVQAERTKELEEAERSRQQALKQFGNDVVDSLQEAIDSGGDLSDVLKKLALDIAKLALNSAQFKSIFEGGTGSSSGGGGFLGGILGGLFKNAGSWFGFDGLGATSGSTSATVPLGASTVFPSHASGIDYVMSDGMAMIHRGETVLNPQESDRYREGGDGGIQVGTIDARGAGPGVENTIRNVINDLNALRKQVPAIALSSIREANKRNPRLLNV